MLNHDEEEIIKILLKLSKEQNTLKISGTFSDFPVKYQIVYKEILERLEANKFIKDFEVYMAEDFTLTLLSPAVNYFDKKTEKNQTLEPLIQSKSETKKMSSIKNDNIKSC